LRRHETDGQHRLAANSQNTKTDKPKNITTARHPAANKPSQSKGSTSKPDAASPIKAAANMKSPMILPPSISRQYRSIRAIPMNRRKQRPTIDELADNPNSFHPNMEGEIECVSPRQR